MRKKINLIFAIFAGILLLLAINSSLNGVEMDRLAGFFYFGFFLILLFIWSLVTILLK